MANFGALTDHFGLATSIGSLIDSTKTPVAQSRADALDENGDVADAAWHGNTDGTLYEASCTYQLDGSVDATVDLSSLKMLGQLATGVVALSVEVATSNGDWPRITISGILGTAALEQSKTWDLPEITISAKKQAQAMGLVVTTGKLTSCTLSASCDLATANDGEGEPVAHGVSGAIASATGEAVAISNAAPVLAAAVGWTVSTGAGVNEPQAAWHTGSLTVEQKLAVTITPPA